MFPIKYIENNLVLNQYGEWFAYYELIPYNYTFLSPDQRMQLHEAFRQVISANRDGRLHCLCISTESSVRERQERCKKHISGKLKDVACEIVDDQTEEMIWTMEGENETVCRFYIGFKLILGEEEISMKKIGEKALMTLEDFILSVNHNLMGDFVGISNAEIERYAKMEKLLRTRIGKRFEFRRLEKKDFGYLIEHIYGQQQTPYYEYDYNFPTEQFGQKTVVKKYDLIRLTRCLMEEHQKHIRLIREEGESLAAYLTINAVIGELVFPSSEIFYYSQGAFDFPVDISMNVEIVANRKALTTVRNKKKELKDLDEHAWKSGNETEDSVVDALDSVDELEQDLGQTKEAMYKLSYVVRVTAGTLEELEQRIVMVRDYYEQDFNIKLVRPFGDMLGLHQEFIPSGRRYMDDYVQYVKSDFLSGLGFGAARKLGEEDGIYIGYDADTGQNVYIDPPLACQGVKGSVTNALAVSFTGSLGAGKSWLNNIIVHMSVLYGAKALVIDPKSERGNWVRDLPELSGEMNIVNFTSEKENYGMLDPYVIMKNVEDADSLALDILTFLTGTSIMDGERFPLLRKAIRAVTESETRGLLMVIDELRNMEDVEAHKLAEHIASFTDYDFAGLLFSDGYVKQKINMDKQLNIIQVQDLVLPEQGKELSTYTSMEFLSVAMMIVISTFALDFIYSDRGIYKIVDIDEAWSFLQVAQGRTLSNELIRAGRSMQSGVFFVTQSGGDLLDEKIKNNIGLRFAFRSTDMAEIKNTLMYFGLDPEDEGNQRAIAGLKNGQCLFMDLYGRIGKVNVQCLLPQQAVAFDTRPPQEKQEDGV